jgi:hypothetical protein
MNTPSPLPPVDELPSERADLQIYLQDPNSGELHRHRPAGQSRLARLVRRLRLRVASS